ncbi:MAG: glutamate-1-semialdehyde 2,1-aminomutase [Spirochaetes bacterium]|nr:glutamate-1-semialdehyde 2,1-aminomutase [Spirochaetota bacterium]
MKNTRSTSLYRRMCKRIPGGVNSPVRAFRAVHEPPLIISRGKGRYVYDIDGNRYVDFIGAWGPAILGHAHPEVVSFVQKTLRGGFGFGVSHPLEYALAEIIADMMPSMEKIRFVNSGTEATMSAIRLARGYTGRKMIVKFDGCYHGHADSLLVKAGSGAATLGVPDSAGIPTDITRNTLSLAFNDVEMVTRAFAAHGRSIACVIVEPVAGNMGVVPATTSFLTALRTVTKKYGAVLIFDEVMSGFRVHPGGAQELYGIYPDITCLGKIIGGGMPVGAFGGKSAIMDSIAPLGPVYQAGTLSGNPLAMAAGLKTLELYRRDRIFQKIESLGIVLDDAVSRINNIGYNRVGGMFTVYFTDRSISNFDDVKQCDTQSFSKYHRELRAHGFLFPPSQFEAAFLSSTHRKSDISAVVRILSDTL